VKRRRHRRKASLAGITPIVSDVSVAKTERRHLVHVISGDGVYLGRDRSNSHTRYNATSGRWAASPWPVYGRNGDVFATHRVVAFSFEYLRLAENPPIESARARDLKGRV